MSGGCYLITVDQVISSLSLRKLKLYSKLGLENVVDTNKNECCEGNLDDRDEYLGLELEPCLYMELYEDICTKTDIAC